MLYLRFDFQQDIVWIILGGDGRKVSIPVVQNSALLNTCNQQVTFLIKIEVKIQTHNDRTGM